MKGEIDLHKQLLLVLDKTHSVGMLDTYTNSFHLFGTKLTQLVLPGEL